MSFNGFISFINDQVRSYSSANLANTTASNAVIAAYWDDLMPNNGGLVRYELKGETPNREFVVAFDAVPHYGSTTSTSTLPRPTVTFQIILREAGGGEIHCFDCQADTSNPKASQGLSTLDGLASYARLLASPEASVDTAFSFNTAVNSDGYGNSCDICPSVFDPDQLDSDGDGVGDACE